MCKVWRLKVPAEALKPWLAQWLEMRGKAGQGLQLREGKRSVERTVSEGQKWERVPDAPSSSGVLAASIVMLTLIRTLAMHKCILFRC